MKGLEYILLFEDFEFNEALPEKLEDKIKALQNKKNNYKKRMTNTATKIKDAGVKAAKFKEKAAKTKDPIMKKIYTNRASEEQMAQQVYAARAKAMQMAAKMNDTEIQTAELKKTRKESLKK